MEAITTQVPVIVKWTDETEKIFSETFRPGDGGYFSAARAIRTVQFYDNLTLIGVECADMGGFRDYCVKRLGRPVTF